MFIAVYVLAGLLFSIVFFWKGIEKVDSGSQGISFWLKMLLLPGMVFFWVFFLRKWLKTK
jgi:hypothetical protein